MEEEQTTKPNHGINPLATGAAGFAGGALAGAGIALALSDENTRKQIQKAAKKVSKRGAAVFHDIRQGLKKKGEEMREKVERGRKRVQRKLTKK